MEHLSLDTLSAGLEHVRASPRDDGRLELVVTRPAPGEREVLEEGMLDLDEGLVGDTWRSRPSRSTPDRRAHPDRQLTLMNSRAAALFAGSLDRVPLAGDQLYVDLDLSTENLPAGTRLAVGDRGAVVEITEPPHTGCAKFSERFGRDAMRLANSPDGRALNLRGVNARVVLPGTVRPGDRVVRLVPG